MQRPTFRELLQKGEPLVMPAAHDALTARLIEKAGFDAVAISGSSLLAARYALPDLGLAGLGDMLAATRDILGATSLPCLGDGDDGYGDRKSVVRTVKENEGLGLSAIVIEDQARSAKKPGQGPATSVVDEQEIADKIQIAVQSRESSDFWIMGRSDAYATLGLEGALKRADLFLRSGADGIFLAGVRTENDLVKVADRFSGIPKIVVIYGGDGWPNLSIKDLGSLGYTHIVYPLALILPVCLAIGESLERLKLAHDKGEAFPPFAEEVRARAYLTQAVEMQKWTALDEE